MELNWRKSSYTAPDNCVEVAWPSGAVAVRDSKNPDGPTLRFSRAAWLGLLALNNGVDSGRPATGGRE